jgi:hypothetical protein
MTTTIFETSTKERPKMSKIWKSNFAMKLSCPAYKSDNPDPYRMEVYKALHEQLRLQYRKKMIDDGWHIIETEMPIENDVVKGKIDDVFQSREGIVTAVDYVSSNVPKMYKLLDTAISAGYLRHELDTDASGRVVSRGGVVTEIPNELIEGTWSTMTSEYFQKILSLSADELLQYANPASGICTYCANKECRKKPPKS